MRAAHSYELKVYEQVKGELKSFGGPWPRAEGAHYDAARKRAREIVAKSGRIIRSLSCSNQRKTRSRGPTTGEIVIVVHGPEKKKSTKTMRESKHRRGLPKEIVK